MLPGYGNVGWQLCAFSSLKMSLHGLLIFFVVVAAAFGLNITPLKESLFFSFFVFFPTTKSKNLFFAFYFLQFYDVPTSRFYSPCSRFCVFLNFWIHAIASFEKFSDYLLKYSFHKNCFENLNKCYTFCLNGALLCIFPLSFLHSSFWIFLYGSPLSSLFFGSKKCTAKFILWVITFLISRISIYIFISFLSFL